VLLACTVSGLSDTVDDEPMKASTKPTSLISSEIFTRNVPICFINTVGNLYPDLCVVDLRRIGSGGLVVQISPRIEDNLV
jgi:hypothetical protein